MAVDENHVLELLRIKGNFLFHREGQELEFKEQFNFAALASYFRDFAAFANNIGGYLIFGVQDSPRFPVGLSNASLDQFEKIDPEKITSFLLNIYSVDIHWDQAVVPVYGLQFGVFKIYEAKSKPIIAKKDEGKGNEISNCDIYYRYGGRTQRIQYAELENIITARVEENNRQWQNLVKKIGEAGPQNAAILDTENALISKDDSQILVIDKDLVDKLRFVKPEEIINQVDDSVFKLVGDVVPVSYVEVVKKVAENRLRRYPFSAMELVVEIKKTLPYAKQNEIWQAIRENGLKDNPDYSLYNFRNKKQQDIYDETGEVPQNIPSIYNKKALQFLVNVFRQNQ